MAKIVDYKTRVARKRFNPGAARQIPRYPKFLSVWTTNVSKGKGATSKVLITATVGVRAVKGNPQIRFYFFKNGRVFYTAQQGVTCSEKNATITVQVIDKGDKYGFGSDYTISVVNVTQGTKASLVGPMNFSALSLSGN